MVRSKFARKYPFFLLCTSGIISRQPDLTITTITTRSSDHDLENLPVYLPIEHLLRHAASRRAARELFVNIYLLHHSTIYDERSLVELEFQMTRSVDYGSTMVSFFKMVSRCSRAFIFDELARDPSRELLVSSLPEGPWFVVLIRRSSFSFKSRELREEFFLYRSVAPSYSVYPFSHLMIEETPQKRLTDQSINQASNVVTSSLSIACSISASERPGIAFFRELVRDDIT